MKTTSKRILLAFLLILLCAITAHAQSTNVSGTIVSADSQAWANGSYRIEFYPGPAIGPFYWNGSQLSPATSFAGSLDSSGAFTGVSIPSNDKIGPAGTRWRFTVCPAANSACYFTLITVTGTSLNVTSSIVPPALQVAANNYNQPTAYADSEIVQPTPGFMYYNLTLQANRQCQGPLPCTWVTIGGGGGGTPANPNGCVQLNISSAFGTVSGLCVDSATSPTLLTVPLAMNVTGNAQFKGNNPYIDITQWGARAPSSVPSTTCTISATSKNCTLASASTFQNGDGVRINGAGANNTLPAPAAPTVIPSLAVVAMETGHTVPSAAGATTYSYTIFARGKNGSLTAQSPAGTTTNGQASLGATAFTNSTLTRANGVVTVVTSSPHNILVGCILTACNADVYEENSTDASFSGHYPVTSAPNNTTFTYTEGSDTRAGATTSATGGTSTVYVSNHIVMPALGSAYQYYICKSGTLVGAARPGETTWDDYGVTAPSLPDFVPTTCPSVATNDYLVTTIASGAGTTSLTLADAAINSVTTATIKFDAAPTILLAATAAATSATAGALRIPSTANFTCFPINSHLILPSLITVQVAGCLILNETIETGSGETWTGVMGGSSNSNPQFGWGPGRLISVNTAYPGIAAANGGGTYRDLTISALNQGLAMTVGPNGGVFNNTFDHFNCSVGSSGLDILGQCIVGYGTSGSYFQTSSFAASGSTSYGYSTAPLVFYRNDLTNTNPSGNIHFYHPYFTNRGFAIDSNPPVGAGNKVVVDQYDSQGIRMPSFMVGTLNAPSIYINGAINDTSTQAFLANMGANGMQATLLNMTGLSTEAGGVPGMVTGNVIPGLTVNSQAPSVGQNTSIFRSQSGVNLDLPIYGFGSYGDTSISTQLHFNGQTDLFWDMTPPTGVTDTPASGGSLSIATHTYVIKGVDPAGGKTAPSASASCTTTAGNQTCNIAWNPLQGAVSYNVYADNLTRIATGITTTTWSDSSHGCCTNDAGGSTSAGVTGANQSLIWAPQLTLVSPVGASVSFAGNLTAPITATRNWTFPDASGVLCLTTTCGGNFYQTVQVNGTPQTQEPTINFVCSTNMTCTPSTVGSVTTLTLVSSSSAATAFSALTAATNTNAGTFAASGNAWDFSAASSFKLPSVGAIFPGSASGNVTLIAAAAAGTPTVTFGTSSGTPAVTASSPLAITTATGNITCTTCATTTNGGALSGTAPIAISVAGAISISAATTGALGSIELAGNLGGTGASPTVVSTTITGATTNLIVKFDSGGNLINSTATDTGSLYTIPETFDLTSNAEVSEIANAGSTGTTIHKLASLTGAPSTAVITTAAATSGAVGIVVGGAGTTSNAQVAVSGQATCVYDGGTTAGDYVQISASVNGDCTDAGATLPSSGQIIGVVLSTNASGGTYNTFLFGPAALGSAGGGGSGTVNNCATAGAIGYYAGSGTAVSCLASITEAAGNISIGIAGTTGGTLKLSGSTSGTITIQPQNAAGTFNFNLPITAGTSGNVLTSAGGVSAAMTWTSPTITINGQACTLAGSCTTLTIDTNGGANTSQTLIDFRTSTGNTIGLTNTPSNPSTGRELFEITGTLTPTGGGTGISAPTAHSLLIAEGASNFGLITSPTTNGYYLCGFNVVAAVAVDPTCNPIGVPVDAQLGTTYTIGTSQPDRATLITANNSGAQTYTAVNPASTGFGNNFPYVIKNIGTGAVTETSSGFNLNGGTSLLIPPSWTAFHWSDNTNYIISRLPDFGAFPTCADTGGNHLNFSSTTGVFSCGTSASTGGGTVTSVALTVNATSPSGIFTVTGSPVTSSGTLNFNLAGTSGGVPYFSSSTVLSSSGALTANGVVLGGGAGSAPTSTAADTTTTHVLFATATAPAFRAVVAGDLPGSGVITINSTSCTVGSSCTVAAATSLSSVTAATTTNTIANGDNAQIWNWATTTSANVGITFGETTASSSAGSPYTVEIKTLIGSTATPLKVDNSLNGSQTLPALSILPTWNTTGVVDAALLINVTNTASGTGSLLIDAQVGGTSEFKVDKAGNGTFNASIAGASLSVTGIAAAGQLNLAETTAPSGGASKDICYGDSTLHGVKCSFNNGSFLNMPLETGTMTSGHVVSVNATTNLIADSGVVAANLVVASSPGAGIAHFAGSTQTVTSSLIVAADITSATITGTQLASSLVLTTPNIGAATGTSLLVTGIVDGTAPVTVTTGTTATLGAATYKSGYTFNQEATAGTGVTYTLPATAVGLQYCVRNSIVSGTGAPDTGVLTVYPPASSFVILNGVINTIGGGGTHGVASGGAAGDAVCFVAIDATHWDVWPIKGTWTAN